VSEPSVVKRHLIVSVKKLWPDKFYAMKAQHGQ